MDRVREEGIYGGRIIRGAQVVKAKYGRGEGVGGNGNTVGGEDLNDLTSQNDTKLNLFRRKTPTFTNFCT